MKRFLILILALGLALAGMHAWAGEKVIELKSGGYAIMGQTTNSAREIEAYWTPERIRRALANPLDKGLPGANRWSSLIQEQTTPQTTEPKSDPPFCPDCQAQSPTPPPGAPSLKWSCPASDYTATFETDYTVFPQRVIGRLLMLTPQGEASCSASLVNHRLILTAGHCVAENGAWYSNFYFLPGYLDGTAFLTTGEWFWFGLFNRDVAFIVLNRDIGYDLGWLGFMTSASRDHWWNQWGYPVAEPFDGSKLVKNVSYYGATDCSEGSPCTTGVGSPLTQGSSGGPWVYVSDDGGRYANGLNSYSYLNCPYNMFSPYFDSQVWDLYQQAKGYQ